MPQFSGFTLVRLLFDDAPELARQQQQTPTRAASYTTFSIRLFRGDKISQLHDSLSTMRRCVHTSGMYSAAVLDHFEHPRNAGSLVDAQVTVEVANPVCGDVLELSAIAADGHITAARFRARGCVTAMACASLLTEIITGKTRAEIAKLTGDEISNRLDGLPPATFHGAQLAIDALAALLAKLKF